MKAIPIAKVRALSEAAGGRGAILLVFDGEGNYSGASYGDTRAECKELGRTLDEICDGLGRVGAGALHTPRIASTPAGRRAGWEVDRLNVGGEIAATMANRDRRGTLGPLFGPSLTPDKG